MTTGSRPTTIGEKMWVIWGICPPWLKNALRSAALLYYKVFHSSRTFVFDGQVFHYFYHRYDSTWSNERAVEISIVHKAVRENLGKSILEVGNVLSHYFTFDHDVLDKYEKANGVINLDIVNFDPSKRYNLIVSISTLEHIGFDEDPREPGKALRALRNMQRLLAPGGIILVTIPLGYNPDMDRLLDDSRTGFTEMRSLKRISIDNIWVEANYKDVRGYQYGVPYPCANGLVIGIIKKDIDVPVS